MNDLPYSLVPNDTKGDKMKIKSGKSGNTENR